MSYNEVEIKDLMASICKVTGNIYKKMDVA
jgi:hypothetical protein